MPRKQRESADVVKARIEAVAIRMFSERDPEAVSLAHIGAEIGTSAQTVHYHYGSKAALREAALERLAERIREGVGTVFGDLPSMTLSSLTNAAVGLALDYPVEFRATLVELVRQPSELLELLSPSLETRFDGVSSLIEAGQRAGVVRPDLHPLHYIPNAALLVLGVVNLPSGSLPLDLESEEGQRTVSRLRDALRMVLVGLFVDPEPHLH